MGDFLGSETLSASDRRAARLDELQFDLGEGPCWQALASARPVLESDLRRSHAPWPLFLKATRDDDIASIFAFPLIVGPLRFGAIDLYSEGRTEIGEVQRGQAIAMADIVGRRMLRHALADLGDEYDEDRVSPFSRRIVHQATGMVLAQLSVSAEDARLVLEGHAFAASTSVMDVATAVVDGELNFSIEAATGIEESS